MSIAKSYDEGYTDRSMNFDRIGSRGAEPSSDGASLTIPREALTSLAAEAFDRLSFTFTAEHLEQLLRVAATETNSRQDRMVAGMLLENAAIASRGVLPICQDTGIANVFAWKGQAVRTAGGDRNARRTPRWSGSKPTCKTWAEQCQPLQVCRNHSTSSPAS